MNDKTLEALKVLADKLGTTAEYLWQVLINQAYISFWTDILFYVITVIVTIYTIRLSSNLYNTLKSMDNIESRDTMVGLKVIFMTSVLIIDVNLILVSLFSIQNTITKIANPEYWALLQVLNQIR